MITVLFGSGTTELPRDRPGLAQLFNYWGEGGLGEVPAVARDALVRGHEPHLYFRSTVEGFLMSGQSDATGLGAELAIMTAYLVSPGFNAAATEAYRHEIQTTYPTLSANTTGVAQAQLARLIRSGDQRYGWGAAEDMLARDMRELADATARARQEGAIEIGIVGNIDADTAIEEVARTFGALPRRAARDPRFVEGRDVAFPRGGEHPIVLTHAGDAQSAAAYVYWPTTDDADPAIVHRFELLRVVFAERLRARLGIDRPPATETFFSYANPGYGYFCTTYETSPAQIDAFLALVDEIANDLGTSGVSDQELAAARDQLSSAFRTALAHNEYWYRFIATAQSDDRAMALHRTTLQDYAQASGQQLASLARAYLRSDRAYRVAILPAGARSDQNAQRP